jgi:hypothetical protein
MLSQNTDDERLSQEFLALTEISKTLTSQIKFSELIGALIGKIVNFVEQAKVGCKMLWDQSHGAFQTLSHERKQ